MPSVFFISLMAGSAWGGSEELWYRSALLALRKGWKVGCAVYHWPAKEARMKQLEDAGARIIWLPNKGRSKRNLLERVQNKLSKKKLKAMIPSLPFGDYDISVVNCGAFEITTPEWRDAWRYMERLVLLVHNYREGEVFGGAKGEAIRNWTGHAERNLFASRRIPEVLKIHSGIDVPRSEVLLNPITFAPPKEAMPYPELHPGYRFVMLAALDSGRKAQDRLIAALSSDKWKARNWTLHLYGEGPDRPALAAQIAKEEMVARIFLEGHTANVRGVLESAHLLLQMTHIDAMPLSVVEAMALARPVVVSRIGDMPYWLEEGRNGWISEDASVASIDAALEKAWSKRGEWALVGHNAFQTFQARFPASVEEVFLRQLFVFA